MNISLCQASGGGASAGDTLGRDLSLLLKNHRCVRIAYTLIILFKTYFFIQGTATSLWWAGLIKTAPTDSLVPLSFTPSQRPWWSLVLTVWVSSKLKILKSRTNWWLLGGPTSQCQLETDQLKKRNPLLRKYIENNSDSEGEALLALQYLMHRLI